MTNKGKIKCKYCDKQMPEDSVSEFCSLDCSQAYIITQDPKHLRKKVKR